MLNNQLDIKALMSYDNNSNIINKIKSNNMQKASLSEANGQDKTRTDEELMEACKTFETYFIEQVLKEMRLTIPKDENSYDKHSYFEDLLYREYATAIANQGQIGLSKQLYDSMKRNHNIKFEV